MNEKNYLPTLWDYYKMCARIQGRKKNKNTQDHYSLFWFFFQEPERRKAEKPGENLKLEPRKNLQELNAILKAFLGDPSAMEKLAWDAPEPKGWESFLLERKDPLNKSQMDAIRTALKAPVSYIQGPPGTGKTETILNLASCAAQLRTQQDGQLTVAIVSSNNAALENVVEKIDKNKENGDNWKNLSEKFARLGNLEKREKFAAKHKNEHGYERLEDGTEIRFSEDTKITLETTDSDNSEDGKVTVSRENEIRADPFLRRYPVVACTIHSLKNCFKDGWNYLYDYVIMDESSQTNIVAGLVAMSCARHLVLVGDPEQLPPVVDKVHVQDIKKGAEEKNWIIPEAYAVAEDRSFLDVCLHVFGDRMEKANANVTLNRHYRCHPGIINFCMDNIYQGKEEKKLQCCTPDYDQSVETPIKVLWFDGNYYGRCVLSGEKEKGNAKKDGNEIIEDEKIEDWKKVRRSKINRKQIRCFMEEEWPELRDRLEKNESLSVCILSPFRGQLAALREAIEKAGKGDAAWNWCETNIFVKEKNKKDIELERHRKKQQKEEADEDEDILPMLTIHKSQGQEYDIIYLLPVEDGEWEWPWSQQKRLINVTVSRAKKELRLILSTYLMPVEIHDELSPWPSKDKNINHDPEQEKEQLYLKKLVQYVWKRNNDRKDSLRKKGVTDYRTLRDFRDFGFHQSARRSIFDKAYWLKTRQTAGSEKGNDVLWGPEMCMEDALEKLKKRFWERSKIQLTICKDVPLRNIRDRDGRKLILQGNISALVNREAHMDFALCLENRILLAIEVDGGYHREPSEEGAKQRKRDELKNSLFRDIMGAACFTGNARAGKNDPMMNISDDKPLSFIRMPNDGTTCLEIRELWEDANESMRKRYFPMEELVEAQLKKKDGVPSYYIMNRPPISASVREGIVKKTL